MATFYLVRHGTNDWLGKGLAGRLPNVHLNELGRAEAERLAAVLARKNIHRIVSSPMERARETAQPLARELGLEVELLEAVTEVDFGEWTGRTLTELNSIPAWGRFNTFRSGTRIPKGESMIEVQQRMVLALETLRRTSPGQNIAIFSHGDPIRSALVYYLGMPLDLLVRLEVSPGSYSILTVEGWGAEILAINRLPASDPAT